MAYRILNDDLLERICDHMRHGSFRKDACQAVGISDAAYYKWIRAGNTELARMQAHNLPEPDPDQAIYVKFVEATDSALAEAKAEAIRGILEAGAGRAPMVMDGLLVEGVEGQWRARAWFLERAFPHQYGRQRPMVVEPDVVEGGDVDVAELIALAAEAYLAEEQAGGA